MARAILCLEDHISLTNMLIIDFIAHTIYFAMKVWEKDRMKRKKKYFLCPIH